MSGSVDLVDLHYADLIRPLGNLVILCAQAEAELLELWVNLTGCNEKEAQEFLGKTKPLDAQEQIVDRAKKSCISGHVEELSEQIKRYYCDRERRNRLVHDEWYVSLLDCGPSGWRAEARTRGLPRKSADVVCAEPKPEDVWELAERFSNYRSLFTSLSRVLRDWQATSSS
jgi:hypothetical protein